MKRISRSAGARVYGWFGLRAMAGALALVAAGTTTAEAAPVDPGQVIQPMGGCRAGIVCGTIFNNTSHAVKVCLAWHGTGTDQEYQGSGSCGQVAYAAPHSVYGTPQLKDVDAFYIPAGTSYYGVYSGIPKKWTHTKSGWWKFGNTTDVHIDWTS
ncbi:hypothetical protein [Amycolatopsis sp. NPDC021455]|uniref:hypothetical protein n=1 Tax=Amycolatopsis sp. NPDC021455 TaxID=3154901 RepID=UPI0033C6EC89